MKIYYLSDARAKKAIRDKTENNKGYMHVIKLLREAAIENIKEGENPWWLTEEKKLTYHYLIKNKPWLLAGCASK